MDARRIRKELVEMCNDVKVADLPIIEEYVKTGRSDGIYKKAIADVIKSYESTSHSTQEPEIVEFMQKLMELIKTHFLAPSNGVAHHPTPDRGNTTIKETMEELTPEERLELVKMCSEFSINDLPAITKFVMTGSEDGLLAKRQASIFENLKYFVIYNGNPMPMYFVQEVAKLIQHCFDESVELSILKKDLDEILSNSTENNKAEK